MTKQQIQELYTKARNLPCEIIGVHSAFKVSSTNGENFAETFDAFDLYALSNNPFNQLLFNQRTAFLKCGHLGRFLDELKKNGIQNISFCTLVDNRFLLSTNFQKIDQIETISFYY